MNANEKFIQQVDNESASQMEKVEALMGRCLTDAERHVWEAAWNRGWRAALTSQLERVQKL